MHHSRLSESENEAAEAIETLSEQLLDWLRQAHNCPQDERGKLLQVSLDHADDLMAELERIERRYPSEPTWAMRSLPFRASTE
jgi:hypothetical protein